MIKIVKALEDSDVLLKGVTKTIKNKTKEQKVGFLSMLLGTLGASLIGHLLSGKGMYRTGYGSNSGKGTVQNRLWIKKKSLMPPHPLRNFEIVDYFEDESRFNGVYSINNLPKLKKEHMSFT